VIGVDTNVLLRMFVDDNASQAKAARALIEADERQDDPIIVTAIVLVETEWSLRRNFGYAKTAIVEIFDEILSDLGFLFDDRDAVDAALDAWRAGPANFADYLNAALVRERGGRTTFTFDRDAAKGGSAFTLLTGQ
jgi:predicted nucleic-acid-binding protein